jgi:hypothetical protein
MWDLADREAIPDGAEFDKRPEVQSLVTGGPGNLAKDRQQARHGSTFVLPADEGCLAASDGRPATVAHRSATCVGLAVANPAAWTDGFATPG